MRYYYLAASLPSVTLGSKPPLAFGVFQALCREHMTRDDADGVDELTGPANRPARHPVVSEWHARESRLRNAIVRIRAARLRRDPLPYLAMSATTDAWLEHRVVEAFAKANPMERELALDRIRWDSIDELAGFDMFATRAVLAYGLRILVAERWDGMEPARGGQQLEHLAGMGPATQAA